MNFYQFYNQQWKMENTGLPVNDFITLYTSETNQLSNLEDFTIIAKIAIETNWRLDKHHEWAHEFRMRVHAMLSAYLRAGYITAQDFVDINEQFLHIMRVSYRNRKQWRHLK